jgi:uncharacterized protein DUF2203
VKRNPKGAKQRQRTIQVWTYAQAQAAAPYIASVVRSLREHSLEALACQRKLRRLNQQAGRPDRQTIIAIQEAERQFHQAEGQLHDAAEELQALDVYTLDPVQGLALVPFVHDEQLAWFIFDLFDSQPFRFWRWQSDPDETRRPVTAMQQGLAEATQIV